MRYLCFLLSLVSLSAFSQSDYQDPSYVYRRNDITIDLKNINLDHRTQINAELFRIWDEFRTTHSLNENGDFVVNRALVIHSGDEAAPDDKNTQSAFQYYVKKNPVVVMRTADAGCGRCGGRGTRPKIVDVHTELVPCEACNGRGLIKINNYYKVIMSGKLPEKVKPEEPIINSADLEISDLDYHEIMKMDNAGIVINGKLGYVINVNDFSIGKNGNIYVPEHNWRKSNEQRLVYSDLATKIWNDFRLKNHITESNTETLTEYKRYISRNFIEHAIIHTGRQTSCDLCNGKGRDYRDSEKACKMCNGYGKLSVAARFTLMSPGLMILDDERLAPGNFQKKVGSFFVQEYDKFEKITKYRHHTFIKLGQNLTKDYFLFPEHIEFIDALVVAPDDSNEVATVYLKSNFNASSWLFHDRFKLKIGDEIIESSRVSPLSKRSDQTTLDEGGGINEVCSFSGSESLAIIEKIAKRSPGQKVEIRLIGKNSYTEREISQPELRAFDDVYDLICIINGARTVKPQVSLPSNNVSMTTVVVSNQRAVKELNITKQEVPVSIEKSSIIEDGGSEKKFPEELIYFFGLSVIFSAWIVADSLKRGKIAWVFTLFSVLSFWWICMPFYLAGRRLIPGEKREGGYGWNVSKHFLLSWTGFIAFCVILGVINVSNSVCGAKMGVAEQIGTTIGVSLGLGVYFCLWIGVALPALLAGILLRKGYSIEYSESNSQGAAISYYVLREEEQSGPFNSAQITRMISAGLISPDDLCWRDGLLSWTPISNEIFSNRSSPPPPSPPSSPIQNFRLAGFWVRACARFIDVIILYLVTLPIGFMLGFFMKLVRAKPSDNLIILFGLYISIIVFWWLYEALLESSSHQSTLGKRVMGLIVINKDGGRISFAGATGRHFGKILSALTLVGFPMAGWTERKQALHDIMSDTLVCYK